MILWLSDYKIPHIGWNGLSFPKDKEKSKLFHGKISNFLQSQKLCDLIALKLRELHETDASDCPVKDRMSGYLALAEENFRTGNYDSSHFPDNFGYSSAEEAYAVLQEGKGLLKNEVLLHGDYCLPNIMLDDWSFSGFIE